MTQYALNQPSNCYYDNQDQPFASSGVIDGTNHIYKDMHLISLYALSDPWNCYHGNQNQPFVSSCDKDTAY